VRPRRRAEVAACTRFGESALTLNTSRADPSRRFELSGVRRARPKGYGEAQQGQHSLTGWQHGKSNRCADFRARRLHGGVRQANQHTT
jgi:hypothetical protein